MHVGSKKSAPYGLIAEMTEKMLLCCKRTIVCFAVNPAEFARYAAGPRTVGAAACCRTFALDDLA
jgi:hypothetical protein